MKKSGKLSKTSKKSSMSVVIYWLDPKMFDIGFMVEKNKELFNDYDVLEKEYTKMMQKYQQKEDRSAVLSEENKRIELQL